MHITPHVGQGHAYTPNGARDACKAGKCMYSKGVGLLTQYSNMQPDGKYATSLLCSILLCALVYAIPQVITCPHTARTYGTRLCMQWL